MYYFKYAPIFILMLVLCIDCAKDTTLNPKCSRNAKLILDKQIGSVTPVLNGVKSPETFKQLQNYCVTAGHTIDNFAAYVKSCTGTYGPLVAKMMLKISNKEMKAICKSETNEEIKKVLAIGKCANKAGSSLQKCANYGLDKLSEIILANPDDQVDLACCHLNRGLTCAERSIDKTKGCDRTMIEEMFNADSVKKQLIDFCGDYYTNSTKCDRLIARSPKLNPRTYIRPKSAFLPIINLLDEYRDIECTNETHNKMDRVVAELSTIGTPNKMPETAGQMRQWVKRASKYALFSYGYFESCTSDLWKTMGKIGGALAFKNIRQYFGTNQPTLAEMFKHPSKMMKNYISAAKCVNKAESKLVGCQNDAIDSIMRIIDSPVPLRMRMTCCKGYQLKECILSSGYNTKGCSTSLLNQAENLWQRYAQPPLDLICVDYFNSGHRCVQLAEQMPKLDPKTYVRPKSIFLPFMQLIDSFPDVDLDEDIDLK